MTSSCLRILGFLTEKQTLGLPAFNDTYSENLATVEIAFAYCNAGGNPDLAGEFLCNKRANTLTSSVHTSAGEARGKESSKSSNSNISENSFYGNGKSRASNTKWYLVSGRTVSSFLGKDYVKPAQPANGTFLASKPLKLDPREFRISALSEKKLNRNNQRMTICRRIWKIFCLNC
ncbi:hypothetical protein CICLE_v10027211mg [Citrus x clementina]|uniref:Uncharacterized protein n=1 Tax=Citrus clementina TaxID=85681 RepID=V4RZU4_CITCL|nr:hypothetical protein CICLE_v10027211mg [Citrus x clementina]